MTWREELDWIWNWWKFWDEISMNLNCWQEVEFGGWKERNIEKVVVNLNETLIWRFAWGFDVVDWMLKHWNSKGRGLLVEAFWNYY
jgi:hypothetical protein